MFNSLIYFLLFYNGVHGYTILDRERREKYNSMDSMIDSSRINSLENLLSEQNSFEDALEHWTGRWMPDHDPEPTAAPIIDSDHSSMQSGVAMGPSHNCDDGQTNLQVDWDHSPVNYTCYGQKITPDSSNDPTVYCEHIPENYQALHICMTKTIEYDDVIPVYGNHRPVWPVYGEYIFLPNQRWLHSLEHGGLVMLYHPCANPLEVERLKDLVRNCLRRHVITPYSLMSEDRPLALVAWGCRLEMSYVNPKIVQDFIRRKALRGPEAISRDGIFSDGIINKSKIVTDEDDTTLCPQN
ncbi:uncharacterized protein LOC107044130 isoform X2 [Diachasma alloeum]|uniref:uncharacterized protein LOC107044130 isoform X2 n=1 Tax=Diachasma alloeum TaxID=454923 RepID=UPI00073851AB|nr:uncharacterized protein LOC107044130 isoform X2 [Diachasma alloeum]